MKKIILLLALFLCSFSFAQKRSTPRKMPADTIAAPVKVFISTSVDEYNYMCKGYKMQIEGGLDAKKGYMVADFTTVDDNSYTFNYKILVRQSDSKAVGYMVVIYSKVSKNTYYVGIPVGNAELTQNYYAVISQFDKSLLLDYCKYTSVLFASAISEAAN